MSPNERLTREGLRHLWHLVVGVSLKSVGSSVNRQHSFWANATTKELREAIDWRRNLDRKRMPY